MARPPVFSVEDKYRLVLSVVSGEMTMVEAARRGKASEQSISRWKQSLESGKAGLAEGGPPGPNLRER
jgi:transposase